MQNQERGPEFGGQARYPRPGYANYLDTSVLVKIVADDDDEKNGRDAFRKYFFSQGVVYTSSHCFVEALSVFKRKWRRKKIDKAQYLLYIDEFLRLGIGNSLQFDDMPMLSPILRRECARIVKEHGVDFIDAMQIVTVLNGQFSALVGELKSMLITADDDQAKAARAEGARVWLCTSGSTPV